MLFNFVHISNQSPDNWREIYRRENPQNPWEAIGEKIIKILGPETNPQKSLDRRQILKILGGGAQAPQPGKTGSLSRKNISKFIQKTTLV